MIVRSFINLIISAKSVIILCTLVFTSCSSSASEYELLIKEEMASGVIYDSLLFDMKFGQTKKQFFDSCWKLNKKGSVKQGPNNKFVAYKLPLKKGQNLKNAITMLFYGIFNENDVMTGMDFQFSYDAWSLWNKNLQSHELMNSIKDSLNNWYPGNDFISVKTEKDTALTFVKVDGNRRILIKPLDDDRIVKAQIDDLRYVMEK